MKHIISKTLSILFVIIASCSNSHNAEEYIKTLIQNKKYDSALVLTEASKSILKQCDYVNYILQISQNIENTDSLVLSTKSIASKCNIPNDSLYPAYSSAYFRISRKYSNIDSVQESKWLKKAKEEATKCINENPNNIKCYKAGVKAIHNMFNSKEELRWIIPAYRKWPKDPEIQTFYGVALMMSDDYLSAKEVLKNCFNCIAESDPNKEICAAGLMFRGMMFDELGKYDSALYNFNASWYADPESYPTATAIGRIWQKKRNTDSACKYYREGLKLGDIREQDWIKMNCNR